MIPLERSDVDRFRRAVAQRLGLQFDNGKTDFLTDILRQRIEQSHSGQFKTYLARLEGSDSGPAELQALAEQLTVAETYFFRNPDHFRAFTGTVIPDCLQARMTQKLLRIVSAGCASGEEAYTLAILTKNNSELASWNVSIQAIDVNAVNIAKAEQARYSTWSLRGTPDEIRDQHFRPAGRDFVLDESIRERVSFERLNLVEEAPAFWAPQSVDVLFCRNVTMYFTPEITRAVMARFARALRPGGYLFLGHAETLRGISHDFHLRQTHDTFYYQRRDGDFAPEPPARWSQSSATAITTPALATDVTWVDAIQRASERIAALANQQTPAAPAEKSAGSQPAPAPVRWDLGSALELMKQERFDDALTALRTLPAESQQDTDTQLLHAALLLNSGRLEESQRLCSKLLQTDELSAGAHYLMALCHEHRHASPQAIEHDRAAIYLDGSFAMPHFHLGLMARRKGDKETAQRELSNALPLLAREDASRILLFGGGFTRDALVSLCRSELRAAGDPT